MIEKNVNGIYTIRALIDDTQAFNDRVRNIFEWPDKRKKHIDYNSAFLYYYKEDYFFRFISRKKFHKLPIVLWSDYKANGEAVWIKEDFGKFYYSSHEPYAVMVAEADWLFKKDEKLNMEFYKYIFSSLEIERLRWNTVLNDIIKVNKPKELF